MLMLKSSMERWVRIFVVFLGMLHISLVSLLRLCLIFGFQVWRRGLHSMQSYAWFDNGVKGVDFLFNDGK